MFSSFKVSKIFFISQYFSIFFISSLLKLYFSFFILNVLTNLWAITMFKVEAIRNGSTFISISLETAPGASIVCIVDITKCPVRAAFTASEAVSLSLISPTIITSGSCLTRERRPVANVSPIFELI